MPGRTALLLLLVLGAVRAGETTVTATVPWTDRDGYTPVIIRAETLARAHEVGLEVSHGSGGASDRIAVRPGAPALRTVLLPSAVGWGGVRIAWSTDGERDTETVSALADHRSLDLALLDPREELRLPELNKLIADRVPAGGQSRGGYSSRGSERVRRYAADSLPDRWQGWPAWLTLATTPAGEATLNDAQREAIATWSRAGGALFVTAEASVEAWRRLGARAVRIDPADGEQAVLLARLRAAADETGMPLSHPVPGTAQLPTAWFICLAIAFAALAGPLNLWWARRRGSPHLLLVTTPLLSLGACLLLVVVALAWDGIGKRRAAAQVAVIDCQAQRAVAWTAVTYFCGISPGRFACDPEDRLLPMDESEFRSRSMRDQVDLRLAWAGGPLAEGGWIPARVNRQLAWTQPRPERRRLVAVWIPGGWRIDNGLGVAVTGLRWTDPQGATWLTADIPAGAGTAATRANEGQEHEIWPGDALRRLGPDARLAAAGLAAAPGSFAARLAAPLQPVPGPAADDAEPAEAWAVGLALVSETGGF